MCWLYMSVKYSMHSKWKWCGHKITTIYSHTSIITIIIFVACSARSPHYGSPYLRSPCISGPSITALLDDRERRVRFFERQRKEALLIHSLLFIIWFPRQVAWCKSNLLVSYHAVQLFIRSYTRI